VQNFSAAQWWVKSVLLGGKFLQLGGSFSAQFTVILGHGNKCQVAAIFG